MNNVYKIITENQRERIVHSFVHSFRLLSQSKMRQSHFKIQLHSQIETKQQQKIIPKTKTKQKPKNQTLKTKKKIPKKKLKNLYQIATIKTIPSTQ